MCAIPLESLCASLYSEMKVDSLKRMPSSTVSVSPIFNFNVTLFFLGMYCNHMLDRD